MIAPRKVASMRALLPRTLSLLSLLAAACAPPPPPARPLPVVIAPPPSAPPAPVTPPLDPTIVSVTAAPLPLHFALDGNVTEWGSLLPPPPPPPPKAPPVKIPREPGEPEPPPPAPNPRDAASHLAMAVTGDGAVIAADLRGSAREAIWLGIGAEASALPPIGYFQRGGGVTPLDCEVDAATNEANPPEAIAACRKVIQRYDDFTAAHRARFEELFRVDREGVRLVRPDGTLAPIEGARAAFNAGRDGATVEIALPAKALPRVIEAPLTALCLFARAATTPDAPRFPGEHWVWVNLPAPVDFEPWGDVRATAFEAMSTRAALGPTGLSYQPGDPLHVEIVSYDGGLSDATHVAPSEATLYTKKAALGDVEVGQVSAYNDWIAVLKKGKIVDLIDLPGNLQGIVERDGAIHVLSYLEYTSETGFGNASWSALVITADGNHREDAVEQETGSRAWSQVSEFHSKTLDTFGVRGWTSATRTGAEEGTELTWRWDQARKSYVLKRRAIPVHKQPAKKR